MTRPASSYPVPRRPQERADWPEDWKTSYLYDRIEVWNDPLNPGYTGSYLGRRQATIDALAAACPPPARVLDLAAAQGNFSIALAGLGYHVTWNDLRGGLADYVRLKQPPGTHIEYIAGNIFELEGDYKGTYDVVLATEIIEHVAHPDEFLAKLATLVKPGGHIVVSTPNGGYFLNDLPRFSDHPDPSVFESMQFKPNSDGHIFLLYEDEMRSLSARAGLQVAHLELITNPLTAGHIKLRYLLKVLPRALVTGVEFGTRRLPRKLRSLLSSHIIAVFKAPW